MSEFNTKVTPLENYDSFKRVRYTHGMLLTPTAAGVAWHPHTGNIKTTKAIRVKILLMAETCVTGNLNGHV